MLLAVLLDVTVIAVFLFAGDAVAAVTGGDMVADVMVTSLMMGLTAWLAPKVSYRRRDALYWITGVGGMWLFGIIAWRVAYLPHRDWPPRDDEVPHAVYLRDASYAGTWQNGR